MHGRQQTVKYCFDKMPFIEKVVICSTEKDEEFLEREQVYAYASYPNNPLSYKWSAAIHSLKQLDFKAVILLGSDDYIDEKFLEFVKRRIRYYDMIGFTDAYYEKDGDFYYWGGYKGRREGEPVGAGKVYSKKFLDRINYNLYPHPKNVGLDYMAHNQCLSNNAKMLITSLKEHGLKMVDVKDGKGMNSLEKLQRNLDIEKC